MKISIFMRVAAFHFAARALSGRLSGAGASFCSRRGSLHIFICGLAHFNDALRFALAAVLTLSITGCGLFSGGKLPPEPDSVRSSKIARTAWTQMGKRYRAGGASPQRGFDCSGLVWWSYGQHGIKVPRITTDQARAGRKVSRKAARAGDIVVFRTGRSSRRGLHTGIYAGNNKFIHSPSSGKNVCLESLAHDYWRKRLIAFRRIGR